MRPCFLKTKHMANEYIWILRYNEHAIERVNATSYNPDTLEWSLDSAFDTFEGAQAYLLKILKIDQKNKTAEQAQAIADIERLSAELKVIEAKINTIHLSKRK